MRLSAEYGGSEAYRNFVERPKKPRELLAGFMREISAQINTEVKAQYGLKELLDSEGQLNPEGYEQLYGREYLDELQQQVRERELGFSEADDPDIQRFYKETHGIEGEDNIIAQWKKEKKQNKNAQMELAVTALLHKVLGNRYLVVRTAEYDDYHNGIDNLILDKETGAVVCAFDEVHEGGSGDRLAKKKENLLKTARKGGAHIELGLRLEDNQVVRSRMENLPVFYLGLNTAELTSLMEHTNYDSHTELSEQEIATYKKLIGSVSDQINTLANQPIPSSVRANIDAFKNSLGDLESLPKL